MPKRPSPEKALMASRAYNQRKRAETWENILTEEVMALMVEKGQPVLVSPQILAAQLAKGWHPPKRALAIPATRR